ncbi:hypothetical protein CEE37_01915 [candidate division LCP-89 bacterium B3_LCP]|uniref:Uncharacterized protein n=1 Tax=candidate division LCP-89 bacterium B3_LCP TaxID=2012998 RepID=A0A532V5I1_UNCL8|nr:MAG: hypothetical protein CEE37_01915 [candidate division LCP-89 bacterium B3_LCP]
MAYDYNILKFNFFDTAVADIIRAIEGRSLMGAYILSFCCIDYMGLGLDPTKDRNTGNDFKKFISEYMKKLNAKYGSLDDDLWRIRNSLIHTYGQSNATQQVKLRFILHHDQSPMHLRKQVNGAGHRVFLNLPDFVSEIAAAIEIYFRENSDNAVKLGNWYSKLIAVNSIDAALKRLDTLHSGKPLHARSHSMFSILDCDPPSSTANIRNHFKEEIEKILGNDPQTYPYPTDPNGITTTVTSTGTTSP